VDVDSVDFKALGKTKQDTAIMNAIYEYGRLRLGVTYDEFIRLVHSNIKEIGAECLRAWISKYGGTTQELLNLPTQHKAHLKFLRDRDVARVAFKNSTLVLRFAIMRAEYQEHNGDAR
jgi:hypothetical protein